MFRRKKYIIIFLLVFLIGTLILFMSKPKQDQSAAIISNEIWANLSYLPDGIDRTSMRMLNLPSRQQYIYTAGDGSQKVVLDVQMEDLDSIEVDREPVNIGSLEGCYYQYNGEPFTYGGLSDDQSSRLSNIETGVFVIEWNQAGAFCRLYGTYALDELVEIAEAIEVRLP